MVSEDEEGNGWIDGEDLLSSLIPVRTDLGRGDLRALYIGWLLSAQTGELEDEDLEPPVPSGLGQLSESLENLAEFLRIDSDLLHVAAEASPAIEDTAINRDEVSAWVGKLTSEEKDELITNLVLSADDTQVTELQQRFLKQRATVKSNSAKSRRTVGQLLEAAQRYATERARIETEKRAKQKARREREAAIAREKHLDSLVGREAKLWTEIDELIGTKQSKNYDQAVTLLVDLRDLDARGKKGGDFRWRIETLRKAHLTKRSFLDRLKKVEL